MLNSPMSAPSRSRRSARTAAAGEGASASASALAASASTAGAGAPAARPRTRSRCGGGAPARRALLRATRAAGDCTACQPGSGKPIGHRGVHLQSAPEVAALQGAKSYQCPSCDCTVRRRGDCTSCQIKRGDCTSCLPGSGKPIGHDGRHTRAPPPPPRAAACKSPARKAAPKKAAREAPPSEAPRGGASAARAPGSGGGESDKCHSLLRPATCCSDCTLVDESVPCSPAPNTVRGRS